MQDRLTTTFLTVATIAVIGAVVFGFIKIGSPAHQRDLQADTRRINDLSAIAQNIYNYVNVPPKLGQTTTTLQKLPASLDVLPLYGQSIKDPVTGVPYEYTPGEGTNYQLCATFALESTQDEKNQNYYYGPKIFNYHGAGHDCFSLDASKSPYETPAPASKGAIPAPIPIR